MVVNLVEKYGLVRLAIIPVPDRVLDIDLLNLGRYLKFSILIHSIPNHLGASTGSLQRNSARLPFICKPLLSSFYSKESIAIANFRFSLTSRTLGATCKCDEIQGYKSKVLEQIYGILVLSLGVPPKPTDTFTWNFHDKDAKFRSITTTPVDFYKDNTGAISHSAVLEGVLGSGDKGGVAQRFSLVNDPRNEYERLLTVARLSNVVGGRGIKYVNVSTDVSFLASFLTRVIE
jgi:aminopeptidase C